MSLFRRKYLTGYIPMGLPKTRGQTPSCHLGPEPLPHCPLWFIIQNGFLMLCGVSTFAPILLSCRARPAGAWWGQAACEEVAVENSWGC